jgi:hypothetical protein
MVTPRQNTENFFVRLARHPAIPGSFNLKFTSIYNSFDVILKENESQEIQLPKSFLSEGGTNSPLLSFERSRMSQEIQGLKPSRVQSARVYVATEPNEKRGRFNSEEDLGNRVHTYGYSPEREIERLYDLCDSCHLKIEGTQMAIAECARFDKQVSTLTSALYESTGKMVKDLLLVNKTGMIQYLSTLS